MVQRESGSETVLVLDNDACVNTVTIAAHGLMLINIIYSF